MTKQSKPLPHFSKLSKYKEAMVSRVPSIDDHAMLEDDEDLSPTLSELEALGDVEVDPEDKTPNHHHIECSCTGSDTLKPKPIPTRKTSSFSGLYDAESRLSQAWSFMTTYERVDWDRPELLQAERPPPTRAQQIRDFARRAIRKLREMKRQTCREAKGFKILDSPRLEGRVGA
ncbi:hypothetical protein UCRPA7_6552 [Phaeoacremonium minimum UCRPA7]|uniref:Uncharacterized protein n=1 Tax=Phaeoacremonium minimum (strain UCR-PA7) TaxID=1286976 RepID=R8BF42_PHAM7|nr:hypothetical protein UCRPA7_6552 [Phaeoacremonium minimum UCRPA7]EON97920.1 hypothetical protein UCRPA7_6552 [Phaeoacremonium minimum UCRPA7]